MQSKELSYKLQEIGFKESESKIFLVLLKSSALSASEIAEKANVRRTTVYEILKSFTSRGFCNEIETNTILKYKIIDPLVIADKIERELKEINQNKIKNLNETFKEFELLHKSEDSFEDRNVNIELIRGFNKHRHTKFIELFNAAQKEVLIMIRLQGYISEAIDSRAIDFLRKGGVIKSIYEASFNFKIERDNSRLDATLDDLLDMCRRFEKTGEQLKISRLELPFVTIFDKRIVFIHIQDNNVPRHNNADIIIKNEDFANRMIDLFNYYWENAFTIDEMQEPVFESYNGKQKEEKLEVSLLN